jgi:hypothetical protein
MVGELQGEHQFPPESARKGRRCKLIPMAPEDYVADNIGESRYDVTSGCAVYYLD